MHASYLKMPELCLDVTDLYFEMHELYLRVPKFYPKMHTLPQNFRIVPQSTQITYQDIPSSLVHLFLTILYCNHDPGLNNTKLQHAYISIHLYICVYLYIYYNQHYAHDWSG